MNTNAIIGLLKQGRVRYGHGASLFHEYPAAPEANLTVHRCCMSWHLTCSTTLFPFTGISDRGNDQAALCIWVLTSQADGNTVGRYRVTSPVSLFLILTFDIFFSWSSDLITILDIRLWQWWWIVYEGSKMKAEMKNSIGAFSTELRRRGWPKWGTASFLQRCI